MLYTLDWPRRLHFISEIQLDASVVETWHKPQVDYVLYSHTHTQGLESDLSHNACVYIGARNSIVARAVLPRPRKLAARVFVFAIARLYGWIWVDVIDFSFVKSEG